MKEVSKLVGGGTAERMAVGRTRGLGSKYRGSLPPRKELSVLVLDGGNRGRRKLSVPVLDDQGEQG